MRYSPVIATVISAAILVAGCSSSSSKPESTSSEVSKPLSKPPATTSTVVPTTHDGLMDVGYRQADSADSTEKSSYYVRPAGIWTTPISDSGQVHVLVGIRLDFTADPLATGNSSINADEYSADDNNIVVNDTVGNYTDAVSKICGSYAPIEKAALAAGLKANPNATGHSVDIYELKPGTINFKACLIYLGPAGDTFQKVILHGFTIWYGKSIAIS